MNRWARWCGLGLVALYGLLAVQYSLATPMFEAPDENYHYAFAQRLAQNWDLPVQDPAVSTPWFQEGSQPPLYYYLSALIIRLVNPARDDFPLARNPHAAIGIGLAQDNNNLFIHTAAESFPWQGHVLALRLIRFGSILLGALTVWIVFRMAWLVADQTEFRAVFSLVAAGFVAFNPQFLFMTSSMNNDNLVAAFAALALWLIILIMQRGLTAMRVGGLALVMALASLTKLSGLTLGLIAGMALLLEWYRGRITWRGVVASGIVFAVALLAIAGWWYLRNAQLYGDLTGINTMIAIIQPRKDLYTVGTFLSEMEGLRISFWALFGWFNVIGPSWAQGLVDALTVISVVAGIVAVIGWLRRQSLARLYPVGILALYCVVVFISLINWTRQTPGTQGRLLFPAIGAFAVLWAVGWAAIAERLPTRLSLRIRGSLAVGVPTLSLFIVSAVNPWAVIAPAYATPPTVAALPAQAVPATIQIGTFRLLGYAFPSDPAFPGGTATVTLYYTGLADPNNRSLFLTVFDRAGNVVGKVDSYPGGGNLPTSQLRPDQIYADTYQIPIAADAVAPMQFKVEFGLYQYPTLERLPATDASGIPIGSVILRGGTLARPLTPLPAFLIIDQAFGAIRLNGFSINQATVIRGEPIAINLYWETSQRVAADYQIMLHLRDEGNQTAAQGDATPLGGDYPTSAWAVNNPFEDRYAIPSATVAAGTYRVAVALYRLSDGVRIPLTTTPDQTELFLPIRITVKPD